MRVITLFGHKRSGKDTFAKYLAEQLPGEVKFTKFAAPLYSLVYDMLSLPSVDPEEIKQVSSALVFSSAVLLPLIDFLKGHNLPPLLPEEKDLLLTLSGQPLSTVFRRFLQIVGTDIVRKRSPQFWVEHCFSALPQTDFVIITDGRFLNELFAAKQRGFTIGLRRKDFELNDSHPSEVEAVKAAKQCDLYYSLPTGLENLLNAAKHAVEELSKFWVC